MKSLNSGSTPDARAMKYHLLSIYYDVNGTFYTFTGLVNSTTIDPDKLFEHLFHFPLPPGSTITHG